MLTFDHRLWQGRPAYSDRVPLDEYRRKRDRSRTPEPVPAEDPQVTGAGDRFVIQEHHARALHWDLRLERDGVLVSWAVPKGLPVDTETLRLAVRTEDHPLEYLEFSGEIPRGEYGGGTMSIWDTGRYETEKWSEREVAFRLHGDRAAGRYVLIKSERDRRDGWLLKRTEPNPARPGATPLPRDTAPMRGVSGAAPTGDGWRLQVRFGGRRVLVELDGGRVRVLADGDEITVRSLADFGPSVGATTMLLDAELTTAGELWIGDLLFLDGRDTCALPFTDRYALLEELPLAGPHRRLAPVYPADPAVLEAVRAQGLDVVAKRADSPYVPAAESADWVEAGARAAAAPTRGVGRAGLTNPRKVLYPLTGTTKADVLAHYRAVAPVMLPHLADRPVTMVRWPDGVEKPSFFEKDVSRHAPPWIRTERVGTPGGRSESADFPLIESEEGLAWAANLAALELHVPQWTVGPRGGRQAPDLLVFDLDPGEGTTVVECCRVAESIFDVLAEDSLVAYPRTSGGKGLQLYLPVTVTRAEQTIEFAKALAERLAEESPRTVTSVMAKQRRRGKVFVDWSQNNTAKTTIASYSLRGRARPTVATPVTWEEVRACRRASELVFTADALPARLDEHGDLLEPLLFTERQRLPRRGMGGSPS
ncbi:bifunctional non-homologous end joining protein LigD [Pseudonocardia oroxyli]|uniref:Bifunctional non-homologous end joining protein LigD n=1 Tax=Pseudonocardia oroxyli TaxID=366584 RepID=A0A1G7DF60_PSEOR|nr:bifunctional non-homologous end joining protein LigD [Pseudonocardia oroxyli]